MPTLIKVKLNMFYSQQAINIETYMREKKTCISSIYYIYISIKLIYLFMNVSQAAIKFLVVDLIWVWIESKIMLNNILLSYLY